MKTQTSDLLPNHPLEAVKDFSTRNNAFDLLRLLLAIGVVITHGYLIGGYSGVDPIYALVQQQTHLGEIGVMGLFALSGYLITISFERSDHILKFLSRRFFRLLPGFWVCLVITAFVFAPLILLAQGRSLSELAISHKDGAIAFVFNNFFVRVKQWQIGTVLNAAAYSESLNGSLWSLFPEIQCYLFTVVAGWCRLFNRNRNILFFLTLYVLILYAIKSETGIKYGPTILALNNGLKVYAAYLCGTCLFVFRDGIKIDKQGLLFVLLITLLSLRFGGYRPLSPILISVLSIYGFSLFRARLKIDLSYGIYIYSFPLQQLLYSYFGNSLPVAVFLFLSFVGSAGLGLLSYLLVEKPFMTLSTKLQSPRLAKS
jgi:peptidoglycan/LPS O-acetylase OafA/YrhL